ncbi:tetratricopeptide repeat protein [bacterium]|nr:tetratricopeptide repeat protein [bacterium]
MKKIFTLLIAFILLISTVYSIDLARIYDKRLKNNWDQPVLCNAAARHFFLSGKIDKASKILEENLKRHPEDTDSLFLMAAVSLNQKKFKQAKDILHLLLKKNPGNKSYLELLIITLNKMGDKKLLAKYNEILSSTSGNVNTVTKKKTVNSIMKVASATSLLKVLQKSKIQNMKKEVGSVYFAKSKLKLPEQEKIAEKLADETEDLLKDRGFIVRDHDKIFKNMKEILLKAPDTKTAQIIHWKMHYYFFGLTDDGNEDWLQVQTCLESYLTKFPDDEIHKKEAYDKLAMASEELKDWNTMLYYAELYLEKDPVHYPMLLNQGNALIKLGEVERGVEIMEKIIKESPHSVQYFLAKDELKTLGY